MTALNAEMKAQFLSNHMFEEIKMDGYWEAVYPQSMISKAEYEMQITGDEMGKK